MVGLTFVIKMLTFYIHMTREIHTFMSVHVAYRPFATRPLGIVMQCNW